MLIMVRERHLPDVDVRIQDEECRQRKARGLDKEGHVRQFSPGMIAGGVFCCIQRSQLVAYCH
jgi:hypothetical protein